VNLLRRAWVTSIVAGFALLLALPALAGAAEEGAAEEEDFDPSVEFGLEPYIDLDFGVIDLSINKAVLYLWIAAAVCIGAGLYVVRKGVDIRPKGTQNIVEMAYDFAENTIARPTLSEKVFPRYFPLIATLFLFIAAANITSFIPLPVSHESGTFPFGIPDLSLYAATANINVTLSLTLVVFILTIYEGVRAHGPGGYLKTLVPDAPRAIKPVIFVLELLSLLLRVVSLSVRLFANLLVGHLLIIVAAGFAVLIGSYVGVIGIPIAVFFWIFEWLLIAGLQAFIFAMLSGIYIGYAVEPPH
jgi:F-type H+-transporting ATPase subunit a